MRHPQAIVEAGYDAIAETYLRARLELTTADERAFLERVVTSIQQGSLVVELGCGAGVPFTAALVGVARVVGVDLSTSQLRLARERVPAALLVRADMTRLGIRIGSVDAVVAFASFGHVPLEEHADLYRSIASWLRPGGVFASQHPTDLNPEEVDEDWMGASMYFSHPDLDGTVALLRDAGFAIDAVDAIRGREHDGGVGRWAGVIAHLEDRGVVAGPGPTAR